MMRSYKVGTPVIWRTEDSLLDPTIEAMGVVTEVADDHIIVVTDGNHDNSFNGLHIRVEEDWNEEHIEILKGGAI